MTPKATATSTRLIKDHARTVAKMSLPTRRSPVSVQGKAPPVGLQPSPHLSYLGSVSSGLHQWSRRYLLMVVVAYSSIPLDGLFIIPRNSFHVVFESPVRSRSFASSALDRDRDRSSTFPHCQKTEPDLCRPVFSGFLRLQDRSWPVHHWSKPVLTGLVDVLQHKYR